ncbi:MAG: Gfo/Idh/MocA family oxidoreductase [Clostridia bacterium]|nr:Gfo/Idh/MocA family oxidoreductase [Clostridia bacterium]
MKKIKVVLIGAGGRGTTYTNIMEKMPEKYEVVAVAEPIESRRNNIKKRHNIPDERCFTDWHPLFELGKIADMAIIATQDRDHFDPAMAAIGLGYHLLLEKPIAPTAEECNTLTAYAIEKGVKVVVCTVLRYTPVFMTLKDIIDSGKIGDVMSINHEECVGNRHQSHSFVRGNWHNEAESACMILAKSCHDTDMLQWLVGKKCTKVQSFGTLSYFTEKNAPEGAPEYCIQGCPAAENCMYNAVKMYVDDHTYLRWIKPDIPHDELTEEIARDVITNTDYGRCVFRCNNDVVDHQTLNMLFGDDVTVTFTMNAFNNGGRYIHIMGTKGEIRAALNETTPITVHTFADNKNEQIPIVGKDGINGGHGGGDKGIIEALYLYLNNAYTGKSVPEIDESNENHLIAFAAEVSRKTNTVVDFDEYVKSL